MAPPAAPGMGRTRNCAGAPVARRPAPASMAAFWPSSPAPSPPAGVRRKIEARVRPGRAASGSPSRAAAAALAWTITPASSHTSRASALDASTPRTKSITADGSVADTGRCGAAITQEAGAQISQGRHFSTPCPRWQPGIAAGASRHGRRDWLFPRALTTINHAPAPFSGAFPLLLIMSSPLITRLRRAYAGFRRIGPGPALRILSYALRLAWYNRRFPTQPFTPPPAMPTTSSPSSPLHPLGPVLAGAWRAPTLHLRCAGGVARVTLVADPIIRVQAAAMEDGIDDFSYAVLPDLAPTAAACAEEADAFYLSTPALRLRIHKDPLALQFQDAAGRDLGGAITGLGWTPAGGECVQQMPATMQCYGLGERAFPLALRGRRYLLHAQDPAVYAPGDDPLYINIPFLLAGQEGQMFGLLYDNPAQGALDLGAASPDQLHYQIASPHLRFDFIHGPTPPDLLAHYTALTGRMNLLPRWVLGYQQSRWSYETAAEVREIAAEFRRRAIPCEAIHLDIDYMDGFRCFTWNPETFPDPAGLVQNCTRRISRSWP